MAATDPLVSIVLPVYNGQQYLSLSIESVLNQHYANWELIIVDDCSSDATPEIARRYARQDERIRAIRHEQNRKLPAALNTGFAAAQGHYFTWTSDDNLYRPHALETLVRYLQAHPHVDLVYSDYTRIDEAGNQVALVAAPAMHMLVQKATIGASFLYKRAVHEALNGYDESLFTVEDYDFWLRASQQFVLQPLHENLYQYRHHGGTLTSQKRLQVMTLREQILQRHLPHLPWARPVDLARGYLHLGDIARDPLGKQEASRSYYWRAFRYHPPVVLRQFVLRHSPLTLRKRLIQIYQKVRGLS